MRTMWIRTSVFSALPIKNRTHNFAIINNVFDALISALGTFTNLLY